MTSSASEAPKHQKADSKTERRLRASDRLAWGGYSCLDATIHGCLREEVAYRDLEFRSRGLLVLSGSSISRQHRRAHIYPTKQNNEPSGDFSRKTT